MSIRVNPLTGPLTKHQKVRARELKQEIDVRLIERGSREEVVVIPDPWPCGKIIRVLERSCRMAGWQMTAQTESQISYLKFTQAPVS